MKTNHSSSLATYACAACLALAVLSSPPALATEPVPPSEISSPAPLGIDALMKDPSTHADAEIIVVGHVDRISTKQHRIILIDLSEATCTDACQRQSLIVQLHEHLPMPAKGQDVTITGTLQTTETSTLLNATDCTVNETE